MGPAILPGASGQEAAPQGNTPPLKIGLIGCGGRGTGAAGQALKADKNVALTAMGDVFEDQLKTKPGQSCRRRSQTRSRWMRRIVLSGWTRIKK